MRSYPGLCIGGPLDGKLIEQTTYQFEVLLNQPFSLAPQPDYEPVRYVFHPTTEGIHFWLAEGETPQSVLTKLALAYMNEVLQKTGE